MSARFSCADCETEWVHTPPSPAYAAAGSAVLGLSTASAIAMLWFFHQDDTTVGGGLGIGALVAMGLGVWLRGRQIPRCAGCKRQGVRVSGD